MGIKLIGVKYCGGCNPVIDRARLVSEVGKLLPPQFALTAQEYFANHFFVKLAPCNNLRRENMIKTKEDYIQSLKRQKLNVYYNGEHVEDVTTHPAFIPHINAAAKTYELALMPEHEDLLPAPSPLTGKKINRFTHVHQSVDDLIKKVQMLRLISHETGSCYQRCVGFDAMNALYMTTC